MDLDFQPSSDKWPLKAQSPNGELVFSGTFDGTRIKKEVAEAALHRLVTVVCAIAGVVGLLALVLAAKSFASTGKLFFVFEPHFFNLIFWLSVIADLYLWALFIERHHVAQARLSLLRGQTKQITIDVYEAYNEAAKKVWNDALKIANGQPVVIQHILQALIDDPQVQVTLMRFKISIPTAKQLLARTGEPLPEVVLRVPFAAFAKASDLRSMEITPLALLCGLLSELPPNHELMQTLERMQVDLDSLTLVARWMTTVDALANEQKRFHHLASFKPDNEINVGLTAVPTPYLDQFSEDLTVQAKFGHLPLALGRESDIDEIFKILDEGKPHLLFVGDIGTGRTTVINDVAHKMATEEVPRLLQDKRLITLQLASIAGSRVPAEKVLIEALTEAEKSGNIVLVMEDVHLLAKMQSSQGLSILEVLLNHLQSSNTVVLATTTENDYQNYLHNALNFESLFTLYELQKLSEDAIVIAACIKASLLESQHNLFFTLEAIRQAAKLSEQYFQDMGQPQKTVAVLTEVAQKFSGSKLAVITHEMIGQYVSEKTHVPTSVVSGDEADKLLELETKLAESIIGQTEAVKAVSAALRRARSGLEASKQRPIASFLFVGPTGVGKTELAKTLAREYFGDPKFLLRLDMSEYRGGDGLQKLLGSPEATANSLFVNHLKNYPFCLFLLDEFEKASPEVLNLFLQVLEDGRLTTGKGETLNLTHTIIIATSNAGTVDIQAGLKAGTSLEQIKSQLFDSVLLQHFAPELLNRFDGVILFTPLSQTEVESVARLQLNSLVAQLEADKGLTLNYGDDVARFIAEHGYDQALGARPIRRFIQDSVENLLAEYLLRNKPQRGTQLTLAVIDGQLALN